MNRKGIFITLLGVGIGIVALGFMNKVVAKNIKNDSKAVVYEMYTFECKRCGYDLAEGEYHYIEQNGWERCPNCCFYTELGSRLR